MVSVNLLNIYIHRKTLIMYRNNYLNIEIIGILNRLILVFSYEPHMIHDAL